MGEQIAAGNALHLLLFNKNDDQLIGDCHFTNIVRGPFQAGHLGFSIARDREGQGLMRECLVTAIRHVFAELGLHRVMANYQPENTRSPRLLNQLGFEHEGIARAYLKIDGVWVDHVLTSLVNPVDVCLSALSKRHACLSQTIQSVQRALAHISRDVSKVR
jgi:ribosomal-protein-alanine N-acetyltransferase